MPDPIYTPPSLARELVDSVSVKKPRAIADFAAGEGALLLAANVRWPTATLIGVDVDQDAILRLKQKLPTAMLSRRNFLAHTSPLISSKADVVLLNPPFTCRGSTVAEVRLDGESIQCSVAMAFLLRALAYLYDGGEIAAIMPASCSSSDKDAKARDVLNARYGAKFESQVRGYEFRGVAAAVVLTRVGGVADVRHTTSCIRRPDPMATANDVTIGRGGLSNSAVPTIRCSGVAKARPSSILFVHTTDIANGRVSQGRVISASAFRSYILSGPAVLLPRVGPVSARKVGVILSGVGYVPSDCIVCLICASNTHAKLVRQIIVRNWDTFSQAYSGTGARYTTLKKVAAALASLGISAVVQHRLHMASSRRAPD